MKLQLLNYYYNSDYVSRLNNAPLLVGVYNNFLRSIKYSTLKDTNQETMLKWSKHKPSIYDMNGAGIVDKVALSYVMAYDNEFIHWLSNNPEQLKEIKDITGVK